MIDNFDRVKKQLRELASVINEFKSEAVQMRVIELLFQQMGLELENIEERTDGEEAAKKKTKRKAKPSVKSKEKKPRAKRVLKGGRPGPGAIVKQLIGEEFFKKPKVVQDIINHCQSKTGYTYKASEVSVALIRAIRGQSLQRTKNDQNQWEYS